MGRTAQVSKTVKRAKRRGISGKDAAAGERDDIEVGVATEEVEAPDRMAEWAHGVAKIVDVGDRALIKLAATAVKGAAKRAKQINAGLDIAKGDADIRVNQADAILGLLKGADNRANITIPAHLLRCAQIGISFEIDKTVKAKEHEVEDLLIEDTSGIDQHLAALERLARDCGMEGQLWTEKPPKAEKKDDDGQGDAFDQAGESGDD